MRTKIHTVIGFSAIIALTSVACVTAQWENPSEKYANAYSTYENISGPIGEDGIRHFVFFARDRQAMINHDFLSHPRFSGAQIMYSWAELEPHKNQYNFSVIEEDLEYLQSRGKSLFIQLQDATFSNQNKGVPEYLLSPEYDGGVIAQRDDNGEAQGWTAKRWNPKVQLRFALLLEALGTEFDGQIEGINLQESAIGVSQDYDASFSPKLYTESLRVNMLSLKRAFPTSVTMQYANFMPGEWLPWEDYGYLKSIYLYGEEIGVGLGAPDLLPRRKGQQNHTIAMMHEYEYSVPLGIAIQDGNYTGLTGSEEAAMEEERPNIVPMLHAFAKDFLGVDYMFWSHQEPYFHADVLPSFLHVSRTLRANS